MKLSSASQFTVPEGMIDLSIGQPSFSLLPVRKLKAAADSFFAKNDSAFLQYGLPRGNYRFRTLLAEFISTHYKSSADPGELCVTAGASQALDMLCTLLARSGDTVYTEEPTYYLALDIFREHRLNTVGIPTHEDGIDLDYLEKKFKEKVPAFLYIIPVFQNPTGKTYSEDNRKELIKLCRKYGCRVIADEVYQLLYFLKAPPQSFSAYKESGLVFTLGSFSKIFAPGIRLGWIQGSPEVMRGFDSNGLLYSGGGMNPVMQGIMGEALEKQLVDEQISFLRKKYQGNASILVESLRQNLHQEIRFHQPEGGFFIWLDLDPGADAEALLRKAEKYGISFHPGNRFSASFSCGNFVRLSFSYYDRDDLSEGAGRFGDLLKAES